MQKTICLLPGDGIGPEIVAEAVKVLRAVEKKFGHSFTMTEALLGGAAIDAVGVPLPDATVEACKAADAVFLGAVGGPKWDTIDPAIRPERGLLGIRKALGLFANLRPATLFPELAGACLLRPDISAKGLDLIVVRELTGGIYFGQPAGTEVRDGLRTGFNTMIYNEEEIARIGRVAFSTARKRRKKVCSVDKANVLAVSRVWREVMIEVGKEFPDRYAAFRLPRHGQSRPVRAHPRLRARHRRAGQGQSAGDDPVRRDDAPPCLRYGCRSRRH